MKVNPIYSGMLVSRIYSGVVKNAPPPQKSPKMIILLLLLLLYIYPIPLQGTRAACRHIFTS